MDTDLHPPEALMIAAEPLIDLAIAEDIGPGDATSQATLPSDLTLHAAIIAKEPGVIAGLPVTAAVFQRVDPKIAFVAHVEEGQEIVAGEKVAEVSGPAVSLLAAERIALNFLQRMAGIATQTRNFVDAVATTQATILDTRKTLPGYRELDKYAVRMGGGVNHRMALHDMMLIKDNHIDGAGSLTRAVTHAQDAYPDLPLEVEVRDLTELQEALDCDPTLDRILLDNMTLSEMREAVELTAGRVPLEASGNVTLSRAPRIAATGVDYISVGSLTHSVRALDLSMKVGIRADEVQSRLAGRVQELKRELGERVVILGHHYQRNEIVELADFRGDSLQLSRTASETDAETIVFCGVHFMAEVAAILSQPGQHVVIPDVTAGCYLADTADLPAVSAAWTRLSEVFDNMEEEITPITYVNSSAALKAFCGEHGGTVCTSSNAQQVVNWALAQRPRVFFFPDQHLARNTALSMGIPPEAQVLWDKNHPPSKPELTSAKVILWPGACNVHQRFRPVHVKDVRERYPDIRVVVHPESNPDIVALADEAGSTAHIIRLIEEAPPGSQWAIGTEARLVHRLQQEHPDQHIMPLSDVPSFCATMSQVTLTNLVEVLEPLIRGEYANEVTVDEETAHWARIALERMLAL
jgi:quinolinate synthase